MELSADIVAREMAAIHPDVRPMGAHPHELVLGHPKLLRDGVKGGSPRVYVSGEIPSPETMGAIHPDSLVVICKPMPDDEALIKAGFITQVSQAQAFSNDLLVGLEASDGGATPFPMGEETGVDDACHAPALLCFSLEQDPVAIFNDLVDIFDHYDSWDDELQRLCTDNAPVKDLLRVSQPLFGNPLVLLDAGYYMVAVEYDKGNHHDWPFIIPPEQRRMTDKGAACMAAWSGRNFSSQPVFVKRWSASGVPTLRINIFDGTAYLGSLWVTSLFRQLDSCDAPLLLHLGGYVRTVLRNGENEWGEGALRFTTMLESMLNGLKVSEYDLGLVSNRSGIRPNDDLYALTFWREEETDGYQQYVARRLNESVPGMTATKYGETVAALLDLTLAEQQGGVPYAEIDRLMKTLDLHAGLSDVFHDVARFPDYYREALVAKNYARSANGAGNDDEKVARGADTNAVPCPKLGELAKRTARFSEWRADYLVDNCCNGFPLQMMLPVGLKKLIGYDETAKVSYVETLRVYLEENMNVTAAARRLCIQRSSLLARLDRLQAILEIDLDDPNARFDLILCIRLLERERDRGQQPADIEANIEESL